MPARQSDTDLDPGFTPTVPLRRRAYPRDCNTVSWRHRRPASPPKRRLLPGASGVQTLIARNRGRLLGDHTGLRRRTST